MRQHVFARLSGFRYTLLPLAPFRFEQLSNSPRSITAWHFAASGTRQATVSLDGDPPAIELADGTARLDEVLGLLEGPDLDHWRIETTVFSIRWPEGFAFQSSPEATPPGFDLHGPEGTLLYLQGPLPPSRLPALAS